MQPKSPMGKASGTFSWERKLATYMVAGGAVVAAADNAQASPVLHYFNPADIPIGPDATVPLDVDGDGVQDFWFRNSSFQDCEPIGDDICLPFSKRKLEVFMGPNGGPPTNGLNEVANGAAPLVYGSGEPTPNFSDLTVGQTYTSGNYKMASIKNKNGFTEGFGPWFGVSNQFMGLHFDISGSMYYGWVRMSVEGGSDGGFNPNAVATTATIQDFGYFTDDAAAVPEPSSFALLALGATGLVAMRRRKSQKS